MNIPLELQVTKIPFWASISLLITITFSGGYLYAQQQDLVQAKEKLEKKYDESFKDLSKAIRETEKLEREALSQIKIVLARIELMQKAIDKLEKRTQMRYQD